MTRGEGGFSPRRPRRENGGAYPLPPALSKLSPGTGGRPAEFLQQDQRDRIILAALEVFGTKGLAQATVQDLLEEAGISRQTFYRSYPDKTACFAALHDELLAWLEEEARAAAAQADGWAASVVAVARRLVGHLLDDPRVARVCTVEFLHGGGEVIARHEAAVAGLAAALREGRVEIERGEELPRSLEALLLAGATAMVGRTLAWGRRVDPDTLVDELPELILIFYLGVGRAREVVRG